MVMQRSMERLRLSQTKTRIHNVKSRHVMAIYMVYIADTDSADTVVDVSSSSCVSR